MKSVTHIATTAGLAVTALLGSLLATAQTLYVYPAKGQSDQQLADDRYACHRWAVKESDFDPTQFRDDPPPRTVTVPVQNKQAGATGKGTVAGAVAGGIIGAHDDDPGKGAVIGAMVGTIVGAAIEEQGQQEAREKAEGAARQEAQAQARVKAEKALGRSNYRRAITACLEGRGYTVR